MLFRKYNPETDQVATRRVWREVGWLESKAKEPVLDQFLSAGRTFVAELRGEAECIATSMPGSMRYLQQELAFSAITGVTTSRIARKQGLARRLTARLIAADAAAGAQVTGLGIFEQGFYELLGFGGGSYEHWIEFDPAQLLISTRPDIPKRLTEADAEAMHQALLKRQRGHGAINIHPPTFTQVESSWRENEFGLGFENEQGELTHFFWAKPEGEHGPYLIMMMAFRNWQQFLELLAVVKNLGDQVRQVRMREPAGVMMQNLLRQPFRFRQLTEKSRYQQLNRAAAYWQARICDLPGCLSKTELAGEPLQFNLHLTDPITQYLPDDSAWQGVAGNYIVTLGPTSYAEPGSSPSLPMLSASVGAFTRLWLGVLPATSLAAFDDLHASPELLAQLDRLLCLPQPHLGWDF
ncbi:MAG: hypothetical protein GXP38_06075 [Chloroflexi bacterium]|nr:hypothetical protein [Chloroflexota bacterium]